jgi:hypothetical protein
MARILLAALGAVMALCPDRVLDRYEAVAFETPATVTAKPWLPSAIRTEGVLYVLLGALGGAAYAWFLRLVGAVGAIVAIAPERYLDFGGRIAYERPEALPWREEFATAARVLGIGCVLLAIRGRRQSDGTDGTETSTSDAS